MTKTVLILGAGVTRAARPQAPLNRRPPLDRDFFEIARKNDLQLTDSVLECLTSLVGDYADVLCQSLEMVTTYLYIKAIDSKRGSRYHLGFIKLLDLLNQVLAGTTNTIKVGPRTPVYRFLLSELRRVARPEDLTLITFNYDLVLERTLLELNTRGHDGVFEFPGCYRIPNTSRPVAVNGQGRFPRTGVAHTGIALLKLHGSMNWQSKHKSSQPQPHVMFRTDRQLHLVDSPLIPRKLTWRQSRRSVYMKPVIVPPVSGKRGMMHDDIVPLWRLAAQALAAADRVVVAGYSCPPLDLEARILLSENLRANSDKRVYVIDPSATSAARFVDLCGVTHLTHYTSIGSWVDEAKIYS